MRIAEVIGSVTLSRVHPALIGGRWLVAVPFSLKALQDGAAPDGEDLVVYDDLGASAGRASASARARRRRRRFTRRRRRSTPTVPASWISKV